VLAGGFATRLRPLSYTKPKPLFPILNRPLIDWILENVTKIAKPVVSARYLAQMIRDYVARRWGIPVIEEVRPLGDGGAVSYVVENLSASKILAINGDVFTDANLADVVDFHRDRGGVATVVLVEIPPEEAGKYGVGTVDESGRIVQFVEKPKSIVRGRVLANAGIYLFDEEALREFPESPPFKLADVLQRLVKKYDVYGYLHKGIWFDIGTHEDYLRANFVALERICSECKLEKDGVIPPAYIPKSAELDDGDLIGPYVVLGDNVKLGKNVRIKESVVMQGVVIESASSISKSIIGEGSYVGKWTRISESVIADWVYIKDEVNIGRKCRIGPNREIDNDVSDNTTLP